MNTISPDILGGIHPSNVEEIWGRGNYSAFYQSSNGSIFVDIAVSFWDNHGELVASVGSAIHSIVDGECQDQIGSSVLHSDGRITRIDTLGRIMPGYIGVDTLYLLLNPTCISHLILVDKSAVMENQESISTDISREDHVGNIGITQLPSLEKTDRFSQLRKYMDKINLRYTAGSNLSRTP